MNATRSAAAVLLLAGLLMAPVALTGCNDEDDTPPARTTGDGAARTQFINTRCPIMTQNEIDPAQVTPNLVTTFRGEKVAFCCAGCPAQWNAMTDEQKLAALAKVGVDVDELDG